MDLFVMLEKQVTMAVWLLPLKKGEPRRMYAPVFDRNWNVDFYAPFVDANAYNLELWLELEAGEQHTFYIPQQMVPHYQGYIEKLYWEREASTLPG